MRNISFQGKKGHVETIAYLKTRKDELRNCPTISFQGHFDIKKMEKRKRMLYFTADFFIDKYQNTQKHYLSIFVADFCYTHPHWISQQPQQYFN